MLIVSFDGIFEFFFKKNLLSFFGLGIYIDSSNTHSRVSGLFRDEWVIGSYLIRLMPILIYLYFVNDLSNLIKRIFFLCIFSTSITIVLSGERAALIYLFFFIFTFFILYADKIKNYKLFFFLPILFIILLTPLLNDKLKNRFIHGFENYISLNTDQNIYLKYYDSSFKMFLEKPFFGYGPKMFREICKNYIYDGTNFGCSTHPHNHYAQLLGETGFIGFTFLLISFIYFVISLFKIYLDKKKYEIKNYLSLISILILFIINLQPIVPTNNFFGNWINIFYFLPLGFYLYSIEKKNN